MKLIKTEEAAGHILCHDITRIIPGVVKDAAFRKGHVVRPEDIPVLLSLGKEHLYVWEAKAGMLHEDEGAQVLCELCMNEYMTATAPKEGKIEIIADTDGLLVIDRARLDRMNAMGELMIAARHGNFPVKKGDRLGAVRIIPLVIAEEKLRAAREAAGEKPVFTLLPFLPWQAGIITTGSEIYKGRIKDAFGPVIRNKLAEYGVTVLGQRIVDDGQEHIVAAIQAFIEEGAQMILCTGGMSVDPDDRTPGAVKAAGADIVTYGAPVLPGAMFLLAYIRHQDRRIPVMGLPGCVMYAGRTIFDLILPRILAGVEVEAADITRLGEGGLCLNCEVCHFPNCGFGKN